LRGFQCVRLRQGRRHGAGRNHRLDLVWQAVDRATAGGGSDPRALGDHRTSWENPKSGARGTVTPISAAYELDGARCHDFLASYINGRAETWMRGEACQQPQGKWEVKVLKPWKRS
jgi:surface antigen